MISATNDDTADNSIGNITGSNSVNVFLGVGLAWCLGAIAHLIKGTPCGFVVPAGSLAFSVLLFCICAVVWIAIMVFRRFVSFQILNLLFEYCFIYSLQSCEACSRS